MRRSLVKFLESKAEEIARKFTAESKQKGYPDRKWDLSRIVPTTERTVAVIYNKYGYDPNLKEPEEALMWLLYSENSQRCSFIFVSHDCLGAFPKLTGLLQEVEEHNWKLKIGK